MVSKILYDIWLLIQALIGYNLVLPLFLYLLWLIKRKPGGIKAPNNMPESDYAVIVTAYEQTDTLPPVIESILNLNYKNFVVYIVADKCDVTTLKFEDKRVVVLRPPETLASNTRSHFYAIRNFIRQHDRLIIIDSDNLIEANCLTELDKYFAAGFVAVQ